MKYYGGVDLNKKRAYIFSGIAFSLAVFIFVSTVVALFGKEIFMVTMIGQTLFSFFSWPIFFLPFIFILLGMVFISKKVPKKEGLTIVGLLSLPFLIASWWVQLLVNTNEDSLFFSLREKILFNTGRDFYPLYLSFLFIVLLIGILAPIRLIFLFLQENDWNEDRDEYPLKKEKREDSPLSKANSFLDAFPNVKKLVRYSQESTKEESSDEKQAIRQGKNFPDFQQNPFSEEIRTAGDLQRWKEKNASIASEKNQEKSVSAPAPKKERAPLKLSVLSDSEEDQEAQDAKLEARLAQLEDESPEEDQALRFLEEGYDDEEDYYEEEIVLGASTQGENEEDFNNEDSYPLHSASPQKNLSTEKDDSKPVKPKKYELPVDSLLRELPNKDSWEVDEKTKAKGKILQECLEEFKIQAEVVGIKKGPVVTMFEILPAAGVKLSKITNLSDNIALRLAANRIRIVAPIPGKQAVGVEIPNEKRTLVGFREMVEDEKFKNASLQIPIILGKDITGNAKIIDLTQTPHLLIAGATGSGKSVCVNSLISSILFSKTPEEVKLILIDPKVVELKLYNGVPHLLTEVITEPKKAYQALQYCLSEMERRYSLLDSMGCREIKSFNRKVKTNRIATTPLPYIVVIVDEFADLMATTGKDLELVLSRLAAMARATGIHLVLATQRPSVNVITGLIKANIPSRVAFMVSSRFDSRIILDHDGAEKLLGKGDMLFSSAPDSSSACDPGLIRLQGAYLSDEEVEKIVAYVKTFGEPDYIDDEIFIDDEDGNYTLFDAGGEDPLMNRALEIVSMTGKASASYLQRCLKIGYNRAARLVEEMEMRGIVGPQNGSKPREILNVPDLPEK